jgi:hypothetical protein
MAFDVETKDGIVLQGIPDGTPDEEIKARIAKIRAGGQPQPPQSGAGAAQPAISGLTKLATSAAGLPVDTVTNLLNLGIAGAGVMTASLPGKPPELIKQPIGGSEWLQDRLRATGQPILSPDNPKPQDAAGTAAYDFVSRGGVLPGGQIPAAASMVAEKALGPEWAAVGGMAPSAAKAAYSSLLAPAVAQAEAQNTVRDATLKAAQDAGYKVIPTQINPGPVKAAVESLAGKAALKQQTTIENQQTTNAIARQEIGVPENTPLTMQTLEARRVQLSAPYKELEGVSPNAAYFLRELRDARQKATAFWKEYETQKTVSSLENYKALDAKAKAMEQRLEQEAVNAGRPELVPQMRQARQAIAKTWDVERALNLGDGSVDAHVLGRLLDHGAKLSGGLETIAKFAQGPGRQVTGQGSAQPTPNVSKLNWAMSPILGAAGFAGGPAVAAAGAAAPFVLPPVARAGVLSDIYQRNFGRPDYSLPQPESSLQSLIRTAILENQQAHK